MGTFSTVSLRTFSTFSIAKSARIIVFARQKIHAIRVLMGTPCSRENALCVLSPLAFTVLARDAVREKPALSLHVLTVWWFLELTHSCSQEDAFSATAALKSTLTVFAHNAEPATMK